MPQNFIQGSSSIKLTKIWHKNRGDVLASIILSPLILLDGYFVSVE